MASTLQELGGGVGGEGATGGDSERKVPQVPLRRAGAGPPPPPRPAPVRAPLGCLPSGTGVPHSMAVGGGNMLIRAFDIHQPVYLKEV